MPEKVFAALLDANDAINPSEQARVLKRLDGLGDSRAGTIGAVGNLLLAAA